MTHYLLVEAVNLDQVVNDTEDLSTRRAGGYMLLQFVYDIAEKCQAELKQVSLGASSGLFELKDGQEMQSARKKIEQVLNGDLYAQATVLCVDTVTDNIAATSFVQAREALLALLRRRQMQTLSFVTDFGGRDDSDPPKQLVCQVDGMRPAHIEWPFKQKDVKQSHSRSTWLRRQAGITLRQKFYQRELKDLAEAPTIARQKNGFTDHLEELTQFESKSSPNWGELNPLLNGKLAMFYADGNSFGKVGRDWKTAGDLRQWDGHIKAARRGFLAGLLKHLHEHALGLVPSVDRDGQATGPRLRIETLMWGGDEFRIVVPAWLGLEVAQYFFEHCKIFAKRAEGENIEQSHSAALVFAHHDAPISRLTSLSYKLAEQGKKGLWKDQNSLQWIVLESFDHAGTELDDYWSRRGLPALSWEKMAINPVLLSHLWEDWPTIQNLLPRRSLYRVLGMLRRYEDLDENTKRLLHRAYCNVHHAIGPGALDKWKALWTALLRNGGEDQHWPDAEPSLDFPVASHLNAWMTLCELHDYLSVPRGNESSAGDTQMQGAA
jgi:hypothetical protein